MKMSRGVLVLSIGLALTLFVAACGGSSGGSAGTGASASAAVAAAAKCTGQPVKVLVSENLTGPTQKFPEAIEGAQAAAQAVNASCELGRPLKIITCDDKFSPNGAAACARKAVTEQVVAAAGISTGFGDSYMPILEQAKIPNVGNVAASQTENTSKDSYPTVNSLSISIGGVAAAAAAGAKKVQLVGLDLPAISFLFNLAKEQATKLGVEITGQTLVPVAASDVTQYAAQIVSSKADGAVFVLDSGHTLQVLKALKQQGLDPDKVRLVAGSVGVRPAEVAENTSAAEGVYLTGPAWPTTDDTNSGIKQYLSELKAIGAKGLGSDIGVNAWSTVHIIADLLQGAPTMDAATLVTRLNASGRIARPELGAVDWSKPAFPDDPVLKNFRVFTRQMSISRVIDGKIKPVTNGFVDVATKATLKQS